MIVRTAMLSSHTCPANLMFALVAAVLLCACGERCEELAEDQAAQYAKKYALSRTYADYERGNKSEREFVAELRRARISEEDYRRIIASSTKERPDVSCKGPNIYYYISRDEIARPHYTITFKEFLLGTKNGQLQLVTFGINMTLCGDVYDHWVPLDNKPFLVTTTKTCPADK